MSGTIDVEETMLSAEILHDQVRRCDYLPPSIKAIVLPPHSCSPSTLASLNNVNHSRDSTPDRQHQHLKLPGKAVQEVPVTLTSPAAESNTVVSPDDSSIEILPEDQMEDI